MPYQDHYILTDSVISHLDSVMASISDPFIQSRYVGFVSVTAVTVYELSIKDILCEFSEKTHTILGTFARSHFNRINGRIKVQTIKDDYINRFGDSYVLKFKERLDVAEKHWLVKDKISITTSYNNVIEWRNEFAHAGKISPYVTYSEVTKSYRSGKEVIKCLAEALDI